MPSGFHEYIGMIDNGSLLPGQHIRVDRRRAEGKPSAELEIYEVLVPEGGIYRLRKVNAGTFEWNARNLLRGNKWHLVEQPTGR